MEICPRKGVLKKRSFKKKKKRERSFQTPGNTLTAESMVSLGTTEGNITRRKNK